MIFVAAGGIVVGGDDGGGDVTWIGCEGEGSGVGIDLASLSRSMA